MDLSIEMTDFFKSIVIDVELLIDLKNPIQADETHVVVIETFSLVCN